MAVQNQPTVFPLEQPTLVPAVGTPASGDFVLIYDVSAGAWRTATVATLQAVSGWTA